jgi:hypothetical protein
MDLVSPLRFERSGTDDEHLFDVGFAGQELGGADPLDGLAQAHVVGQHGPARAGGEGDAVELIGKQRNLQERRAQRMLGGIAADVGRPFTQPLLNQTLLDELFGIGIDRDILAEFLQMAETLEQIMHILDGPVFQRPHRAGDFIVHALGSKQSQRHLVCIAQGHGHMFAAIGRAELARSEAALTFFKTCGMCLQVPSVLVRKSGHEQ